MKLKIKITVKQMSIEKFKTYRGVFDEFTLKNLENLKRKGYFDELGNLIKCGKESDVYTAFKDDKIVAIKIYRINTTSFRKIFDYIKYDKRFLNIKGNLRKVICIWAQKEFRNLLIIYKNGILCPKPIKQLNNVLIMEYLEGNLLKDTEIENPQKFYEILKNELEKLKNSAKLIHGDLSEYNIIVKNDLPYIIDVSQAMSIKNQVDFENLRFYYDRDILNIENFFKKRFQIEQNFF